MDKSIGIRSVVDEGERNRGRFCGKSKPEPSYCGTSSLLSEPKRGPFFSLGTQCALIHLRFNSPSDRILAAALAKGPI
jgi:hypothetical protein